MSAELSDFLKRLICLFALLPLFLGCAQDGSDVGKYITQPFECRVALTCNSSEYTLSVSKCGADLITLTVIKPLSIEGLSISVEGGMTQSYKGIDTATELPTASFAKVMLAAFSQPSEENIRKTDEGYEITFECDGDGGILLLDSFSYVPLRINWKEYNAEFSHYSVTKTD